MSGANASFAAPDVGKTLASLCTVGFSGSCGILLTLPLLVLCSARLAVDRRPVPDQNAAMDAPPADAIDDAALLDALSCGASPQFPLSQHVCDFASVFSWIFWAVCAQLRKPQRIRRNKVRCCVCRPCCFGLDCIALGLVP